MPDKSKRDASPDGKPDSPARRPKSVRSPKSDKREEPIDTVDEASQESFPASDSPAWSLPQQAEAVVVRQLAEPSSVVALEAKSSEKDAEIAALTDQLQKTDEKSDDLVAQQEELKRKIETAVEKTHELHTKIVAGKNDLGGES